jgi:hypothetical protein
VSYLAAIARGAWVLHESYVERSVAAGRWLEEAAFELEDVPQFLPPGGDGGVEGEGRDGKRRASSSARAGDENETERGGSARDRRALRDSSAESAPRRVGPAGGRARVAKGRPGAFAGETVAVVGSSGKLLVGELESLLEAGGAKTVPGAAAAPVVAGSSPTSGRRDGEAREMSAEDAEAVPDSQDSRGGGGGSFSISFSVAGFTPRSGGREGSGARGAERSGGAVTAVVMSSDLDEGAVADAERRWGAPAVDWHWVFHSLVHHEALPKGAYALRGRGGWKVTGSAKKSGRARERAPTDRF